MSLHRTARLLDAAMSDAAPFRDLLHRSIALRAAEQIVPDAQYNAVSDERFDTDAAIKARLCATMGLAEGELTLLGDIL